MKNTLRLITALAALAALSLAGLVHAHEPEKSKEAEKKECCGAECKDAKSEGKCCSDTEKKAESDKKSEHADKDAKR